jgi:hypothetical protein
MVTAFALVSSTVIAQDAVEGALVTDRPDATESSETVARGRFQLEAGYSYASLEQTDLHSIGELLLRVGLLDQLELRVGFNALALTRSNGMSSSGLQNLGIGAKLGILSGGGVGHARPTIALLAGTTLPTGSDNVDDPRPRVEARVAAAWDLTARFSVGTNLIWSSIQEDESGDRFEAWGLSVALGYGLSDRWGAYFEYFGAYPTGDRGGEDFLNTGLTYLINNDLQLDGRVGYRLNSPDTDYFVGAGTSVRW